MVDRLLTKTRCEHDLLLCCARTCMDSERADRISSLLKKDIDWGYLLQIARPHGMLPLLHWHLQAACPGSVPTDILEQLREHFNRNLKTNLFLTGELLSLLARFESQGIPAVPFKGPILAASVYGNLSLRQFRDLDILVHKEDVPRAKDLLVSQGYRTELYLNRAQEAAFLKWGYEISFERHAGRLVVGLHWGIIPKLFACRLDHEQLWKRLEPVSLFGKTVLSFAREDLLLILCIHGSKHGWERSEWICGVAELVRIHHGIEWEWLIDQAGAQGSKRMLFLGLVLASDLLGAVLPEEVLQRVKSDAVVNSLAAQMRERLFRGVDGPFRVFKNTLFNLRAKDCLWDSVLYGFRYATIPRTGDWAILPLPRALSFLYFLIRPFRLLGEYGRKWLASRI